MAKGHDSNFRVALAIIGIGAVVVYGFYLAFGKFLDAIQGPL